MHGVQEVGNASRYDAQVRRVSLNDDDFYVVDLGTKSVVQNLGKAAISSYPVKPGQALLRGMAARGVLA